MRKKASEGTGKAGSCLRMSNEAPTVVLPQGFGSHALSLPLWVNAEHSNSPTEAPSSLQSPSKSNFPSECYVFISMYIYACVQRLVFPMVSGGKNEEEMYFYNMMMRMMMMKMMTVVAMVVDVVKNIIKLRNSQEFKNEINN